MTSRYYGNQISASQQSVLTETVICIVKRWKKVWAAFLFPSACHAQKVMLVFLVPYLQDQGLLRSQNFATIATSSVVET